MSRSNELSKTCSSSAVLGTCSVMRAISSGSSDSAACFGSSYLDFFSPSSVALDFSFFSDKVSYDKDLSVSDFSYSAGATEGDLIAFLTG